MNNSGIAMPRPSTVAIIAWPMPWAIRRGSLVPEATIARNVMIMPMTVPMRPSNGPAATASRKNDWKRSRRGTSRSTASEMRSSASSALVDSLAVAAECQQHAAEWITRRRIVEVAQLCESRRGA